MSEEEVLQRFPVGTRVRFTIAARCGKYVGRDRMGVVVKHTSDGRTKEIRLRIHIEGNKNPLYYSCLADLWEPVP